MEIVKLKSKLKLFMRESQQWVWTGREKKIARLTTDFSAENFKKWMPEGSEITYLKCSEKKRTEQKPFFKS